MKKNYESPVVEVMDVEVESQLMSSSPGGEMEIDPNNPSDNFGE